MEKKELDRIYYQKHKGELKYQIQIKKYRQEHRDEMKEYKKKYYQEHKNERKKIDKEYYQAHKEKIKERVKKYSQKNKDKIVIYIKEYREKNKTRLKNKSRKWRKENKEEIRKKAGKYYKEHSGEIKKRTKKYAHEHRGTINEHTRNRKLIDARFKLDCLIRGRFRIAIKNNAKSGSAVRDLGCTIPELKFFLEGKFQDGMTWENWSRYGWHIDHIIPLAAFDLTDREQLLKAVHHTNLQPLWAVDNLKKGHKITYTL